MKNRFVSLALPVVALFLLGVAISLVTGGVGKSANTNKLAEKPQQPVEEALPPGHPAIESTGTPALDPSDCYAPGQSGTTGTSATGSSGMASSAPKQLPSAPSGAGSSNSSADQGSSGTPGAKPPHHPKPPNHSGSDSDSDCGRFKLDSEQP